MEERIIYQANANLLQTPCERDTIDIELLRLRLAEMERQLISMLVTVQRAQGKEPTILTRAERRRR